MDFSFLWPLSRILEWLSRLRKGQKEKRIRALKDKILTYFEQAISRGVYGRFCPSREDILQAMGTEKSQDVSEALTQLIQDGFVEYGGGRYYLTDRDGSKLDG